MWWSRNPVNLLRQEPNSAQRHEVAKFHDELRPFRRYLVHKMINLNDATIREALLRKLERQKSRPRAVLQELHVHDGNKRTLIVVRSF